MNYAMPVVAEKSASEVRTRPLTVPRAHPVTAQPAANEDALVNAEAVRPIDPMLLVYQERVETFRLIAAALRRGYRVLAHSFAS
jgi:hypothetical protein